MDVFQASLLAAIDGDVPKPGAGSAVRVCQVGINTDDAHNELDAFNGHKISRKTLCSKPFSMLVRSNFSMRAFIKNMPSEVLRNSVLVYSMWEGYKSQKNVMTFLNFCQSVGMEMISLHTSGHADTFAIKSVIAATSPDERIPVHTLAADKFESLTR